MLRNVHVTYVSVLPIHSSDEYAGIVIFNFFLQRLLGFGVLLAKQSACIAPYYRDSKSLLFGDTGKTQTWQMATKNKK